MGLVSVLLSFNVTPLVAQQPPKVLDIIQERLKPNSEAAYDRNERDIARTCAKLKCPVPYLALQSLSGEKEVWWLNAYESDIRREELRRAFESNDILMSELRKLGQRKEALRYKPVSTTTRYRGDLSNASCWNVGGAHFFVITVTSEARKSDGCVFEASDGTLFIITATTGRLDAIHKTKIAGPKTTIFKVQPKWSNWPPEARTFFNLDEDNSKSLPHKSYTALARGTNVPVQTTRSDCRRDLPTEFASRLDPPPFHFESAARLFSTFQFERASRQPAELFDSIHPALAVGHRASGGNPTRLGH
jgi:hypothetical protein